MRSRLNRRTIFEPRSTDTKVPARRLSTLTVTAGRTRTKRALTIRSSCGRRISASRALRSLRLFTPRPYFAPRIDTRVMPYLYDALRGARYHLAATRLTVAD